MWLLNAVCRRLISWWKLGLYADGVLVAWWVRRVSRKKTKREMVVDSIVGGFGGLLDREKSRCGSGCDFGDPLFIASPSAFLYLGKSSWG